MTNNSYYLDFNVTGAERKRLVQALSEYTGADFKYLGAPSFAYEVDTFTVDRNGVVSFEERMESEDIEALLETLADAGFVSQVSNLGCEDEEDGDGQGCGWYAHETARSERQFDSKCSRHFRSSD